MVNASAMNFELADAGKCYHGKSASSHGYCLPSIIIIGAMKAGTTEMVTWMKMHPAISASRHELEFFSNDFIYDGSAQHAEVVTMYPMGVASFKMSRAEIDAGRVVMETSPEYMYTKPVPRRVLDFMPSTRLLALLRNPADRMYSQFQMDCRHEATASFRYVDGKVRYFARRRPDPSLPAYMNRWPTAEVLQYEKAACNETYFDAWVKDIVEQKKTEIVPGITAKRFFQIAASQYEHQLRVWNDLFPCQVYVTTSDLMRNDMEEVLSSVYTWLGLPQFDYRPFMEKNDRGFWVLKAEWSKARNRQYPKMLESTQQLLNEHFF
jgi:hypothetical protein